MKVIRLELGDKTYVSGKITTYLTKQAIRLQKDALKYANNAMMMDQTDLEAADEVLEGLLELQDKKSWLLCEAFNNQFTADELEKNLTQEEIDEAVNKLIGNVGAAIEKN